MQAAAGIKAGVRDIVSARLELDVEYLPNCSRLKSGMATGFVERFVRTVKRITHCASESLSNNAIDRGNMMSRENEEDMRARA